MDSNLRPSGIDVVGDIPWGTHFCHFYQTDADLVDTSVPFLKAGLDNGEYCMWMIAEPISEEDAWTALRGAIPSIYQHRDANSIEVRSSRDWYLRGDSVELKDVIEGWQGKLATALATGHSGLRVTGGTLWLPRPAWCEFCDYERELNTCIIGQPMAVMCTYSLPASTAGDVLDVARTHQFATARRHGEWEIVETPGLKGAKVEIERLNLVLEQRVIERTLELNRANEDLEQENLRRQRAEEALGERERQFHALFDKAPIGIGLFDRTGRIFETNRAFEEMLEHTSAELCRLSPYEIISRLMHPEDAALVRQRLAELLDGRREQYRFEERHYRRDGTLVWGNLAVTMVRDDAGRPMFGVAMLEDVTARRRADEALRKAHMDLARISRVMTIGEMTASIAHEVNQPLAAVHIHGQACLRWLAHEPADINEARAAAARIIEDSSRAGAVIERIRMLVKNTTPRKAWLNINDVVLEVLALAQSEAQRHGVGLRAELSSDLGAILGDRIQLQQVILNLVMNGIEAISGAQDQGSPADLAVSSLESGSGHALVEVRDSGVGIATEHATRLFDAFFTTKPDGIGMGLSISRSIIESHGGRLWATANPDRGATFHFTLPFEPETLP